jgi:hypothetical protein
MGLGMAASAAGGAITRNTALNNAHSQRPRATAPSRRPSAVSTASTKRRMRPPSIARWCRHSRWPANGARRPGRQQHSRHHQAEHLRPFRWRYPASGRERVQGRFGGRLQPCDQRSDERRQARSLWRPAVQLEPCGAECHAADRCRQQQCRQPEVASAGSAGHRADGGLQAAQPVGPNPLGWHARQLLRSQRQYNGAQLPFGAGSLFAPTPSSMLGPYSGG